jgi:hypothetical protein
MNGSIRIDPDARVKRPRKCSPTYVAQVKKEPSSYGIADHLALNVLATFQGVPVIRSHGPPLPDGEGARAHFARSNRVVSESRSPPLFRVSS